MGTKIDEAIICIQDMQLSYQKTGERLDYLDVAIETMRKYQKIQEIVQSKTTRVSYDIGFRQIKKVLEDGNDTTNTGSNRT